MLCVNCSNEFEAARKSAKYCSAKCRVYSKRVADVTVENNKNNGGDILKYSDADLKAAITEAVKSYMIQIKELREQLGVSSKKINVSGVAEDVINYE